MTNKVKSVKKNYIYNLLYQIFLIIIPIAVTPYVARVLGTDGSGQYSFVTSIISYFTLFAALGFERYSQRLIAQHRDNKKQQTIDFWEVIICRLVPCTLTTLIFTLFIKSGFYDEKYKTLLIISSLNIFAVYLDISFLFQGNEDFGRLVIRNIIIKIIGIALIFLFIKEKDDLNLYTLILCGMHFLGFLSLWPYLPKYLTKISIRDIHPFRHLLPTLLLFLPTIATSIYTSLDKTLIGIITKSDIENGYYEYAEKLVKMALTVLTSLGAVMIPRNSLLFEKGELRQLESNINKAIRYVCFLGLPLSLGIMAISNNLIPWYLGEDYIGAIPVMQVLAPIIFIIGISNVLGIQYLLPTKQDNRFTFCIICGAVFNFILNCFFIRFYGALGAAIATTVAESIVSLSMVIMARKILSFKKTALDNWKYFLGSIIMFFICYIISNRLTSSIRNSAIIIASGIFSYFLVLILLRDSFLITNIKKLIRRNNV